MSDTKPSLPSQCRQHKRPVKYVHQSFVNDAITEDQVEFECGCSARAVFIGDPHRWELIEKVEFRPGDKIDVVGRFPAQAMR